MRRPGLAAALLAAFALAVRAGYVILQPATDPTFHRPMLDGAYYVAWARAIATGGGGFEGVYYLGPLYPFLLAALLAGPGIAWSVLYLIQHAMVVGAALLLGRVAAREAGEGAGLAASAIVLLYPPALFFASRPLSEPLALLLLAGAVASASRGWEEGSTRWAAASGLLGGLAALARPNLLLVPALFFLGLLFRKRFGAALLLAAAAAIPIAPAAMRNLRVSGHLVPVSANAGIVLWLGNAPGAVGLYTPVEGFSGRLATQQEEAQALASARAGRELDAVEADRFFLREALRARASDPLGTIVLLVRRLGLTLDAAEHGLDYAPSLDRNPLRWAAPLPFAVILGLAAGGIVFGRSGGFPLWSAAAACAATPLLFYVSSRHRLPLAILLAVPAGIAVVRFVAPGERRRKLLAAAVAGILAAASFAMPTREIERTQRAAAMANLAVAWKDAGRLDAAAALLERALALDPEALPARFNLGVVREAEGRPEEAARAYREVLAQDPGHAEAAGNLAALLVRAGAPREAEAVLREALLRRPEDPICWGNLVVALAAAGELEEARDAAREAASRGVSLDPELLLAIGYPAAGDRTP